MATSGPADHQIVRVTERLAHAEARVRRIALRDLAFASALPSDALDRLTSMLAHEPDDESRLLIVRLLAERLHYDARSVLQELVERPETPVRIAHAARIALDRLDINARVPYEAPPSGPRNHPQTPPGTMAP